MSDALFADRYNGEASLSSESATLTNNEDVPSRNPLTSLFAQARVRTRMEESSWKSDRGKMLAFSRGFHCFPSHIIYLLPLAPPVTTSPWKLSGRGIAEDQSVRLFARTLLSSLCRA